MIPVKPVIEADLLIVGGGIGGLMAGIAAGKAGCKHVVIMEKCHARRSGSGATGNDHFNCYIPSYHGDDIEPVFKETMQSLVGQLKEPSLMHKFLEKSFELVQMWDAWGVNMRPTGDWECKGHALPGKPRAFLKYDGSDQKKVLVREAKAGGVRVMATGRSDFPNQVNNVLCFPGLFKGALSVRARDINDQMKLAAAYAIADLITDADRSEENIIPGAFDPRVAEAVAAAVAKAARETGTARL